MEFLKIIGLTLLALIGMKVLVGIMNKRASASLTRKKLIYSSLLTLTISSYFYITYSINAYNRLFNETRHSLTQKIEDAQLLAYGTKADNLTNDEYSCLTDMTWFPEIPKTANKISYLYTYDGFLPDYTFRLSYEVPVHETVDTMNYEKGDFSKSQTVENRGDRKLVTYEEGQW